MGNSVEVAPLVSTREDSVSSNVPRWQVLTLLLLTAWLYASVLYHLVLAWIGPAPWKDPNFGHGIFVPLFALFVVWQNKKKLLSIPASPSWTGIPIIVFSLIVLMLGRWGAEPFSSRVSLLLLLAGTIILFEGWHFFRAVLFPWAFLFLMIPIPVLIMNEVTFPLQLLASRLATGLLELVGVPVLRQGNLIKLAAMPLDVAEACSGIRSLLTLVTLAVIYGYLMETRKWVRVLLVCLAIPIAVAANSFRIFGTGLLVQYWNPDKAEGFYHSLGGWLIFVVALIMLFAVHRVISLIWKPTPVQNPNPNVVRTEPTAPNPTATKSWTTRFAVVAALMLTTAILLQAHSRNEVFPPRTPLSSLPMKIDGFTAVDVPIDQQSLEILGPGDFLMRDYNEDSSPTRPWINLYIAYFPTQKAGGTIHSPNHCLPGAGWVPISRKIVQLTAPDGSSFPANQFVVSNSGERRLVLYWFQAHGRVVASEYQAKYYLISDSISLNRSDGALVRLMTPILEDETPDAAKARMMQLGSPLVPMLDSYIPR
jgi:exosortase D (VPLPA-CTERM-specific)